jgi:hypothetical protein
MHAAVKLGKYSNEELEHLFRGILKTLGIENTHQKPINQWW